MLLNRTLNKQVFTFADFITGFVQMRFIWPNTFCGKALQEQDFGWETIKEEMMWRKWTHLALLGTGCGGVDCIRLTKDTDQWRTLHKRAVKCCTD